MPRAIDHHLHRFLQRIHSIHEEALAKIRRTWNTVHALTRIALDRQRKHVGANDLMTVRLKGGGNKALIVEKRV